jgi:hypothetical protein
MKAHLMQHELLQRSKGYEMIVAFLGSWIEWGVVTCPICKKRVTSVGDNWVQNRYFVDHVDEHTDEERIKHVADLAQMLRPYLTGKEAAFFGGILDKALKWYLESEFRAQIEAGILPKREEPKTTERGGLQPGNSTKTQELDFEVN